MARGRGQHPQLFSCPHPGSSLVFQASACRASLPEWTLCPSQANTSALAVDVASFFCRPFGSLLTPLGQFSKGKGCVHGLKLLHYVLPDGWFHSSTYFRLTSRNGFEFLSPPVAKQHCGRNTSSNSFRIASESFKCQTCSLQCGTIHLLLPPLVPSSTLDLLTVMLSRGCDLFFLCSLSWLLMRPSFPPLMPLGGVSGLAKHTRLDSLLNNHWVVLLKHSTLINCMVLFFNQCHHIIFGIRYSF